MLFETRKYEWSEFYKCLTKILEIILYITFHRLIGQNWMTSIGFESGIPIEDTNNKKSSKFL